MAAQSDIRQRQSVSTDWSIVRQVDELDTELALAKLCKQYWRPLYTYVRSEFR
jgi:hypothetical protein